jgi:hypothetical protein
MFGVSDFMSILKVHNDIHFYIANYENSPMLKVQAFVNIWPAHDILMSLACICTSGRGEASLFSIHVSKL